MIALTISKSLLEQLRASIKFSLATNNTMAYRLAIAFIMLGEGHEISEIAKLLGVSGKTVFNWILKFMSGGMAWLTRKHYQGRGRKEKLTKAQKKELHDMIVEGPEKYGFSSGIWNSAMIAHLISEILIRSEFQMALLHKRIDHFGPSFWVTKPLGSQVCQ